MTRTNRLALAFAATALALTACTGDDNTLPTPLPDASTDGTVQHDAASGDSAPPTNDGSAADTGSDAADASATDAADGGNVGDAGDAGDAADSGHANDAGDGGDAGDSAPE